MSLPREIKEIIGEYEGDIFRIDKGTSFFTFGGEEVDLEQEKTKVAITLPLNLKAGYWRFTQGPMRHSIVETGDSDLALVPTYILLFYHQSFNMTLLPRSVALSAQRGPPYAKFAPKRIKSELFASREATVTLCSGQKAIRSVKLNDLQPAQSNDEPSIIHAVDTPYGVKEEDLYTVIAFPIIVIQSRTARDFDNKINNFLRQRLVTEAEEKTGITLRLEGDGDLNIDHPEAKTFELLGLPSAYDDGAREPFKRVVIDREGAMGVVKESEEPHYLFTSNESIVLQQLRTLSDQLSNGVYLRSYISNPAIKAALDKAIATGEF